MAMTLTVFVVGGNVLLLLWSLYQFVQAKIRESKEEKRLKREREALAGVQGQRMSGRPSILDVAVDKMNWVKSKMMTEEARQARTRSRTVDSSDPTSQSRPNPLEGSAVVNIEMPTIESSGREGAGEGEVKTTDAGSVVGSLPSPSRSNVDSEGNNFYVC